MKFKTMRLTRTCVLCQTPITYRKESILVKNEQLGIPHLHKVCEKPYYKRLKRKLEFQARTELTRGPAEKGIE